jgi:hypothetical protein
VVSVSSNEWIKRVVAQWTDPPGGTVEPFKLTRWQWEWLLAMYSKRDDRYEFHGAIGDLAARPVELVDDPNDSMLCPGWPPCGCVSPVDMRDGRCSLDARPSGRVGGFSADLVIVDEVAAFEAADPRPWWRRWWPR